MNGVCVGFLLVAMVVPALICFFKGKVWMGLIGLFVPGVSLVGAFRPAKPGSLWAHRFSRPAPAEQNRATG